MQDLRKRIYLASPYTHPCPAVRQDRFERVSRVAGKFMKRGNLIFSPITHGHALCTLTPDGLPEDYAFWEEHCLSFLRNWANYMYVFTLPGWELSCGVQAEIAEAKRLGLPVLHIL